MRLSWHDLGTPRADRAHGKIVEVTGWPTAALGTVRSDYFLLMAEANCCAGCVPANRLAVIEVFAEREIDLTAGALRLSGTLHVEADDNDQWRYQLRGVRTVGGIRRRHLLAASPLICLPVPSLAQPVVPTIDMHSHAGKLLFVGSNPDVTPVAQPMRQGGVSTLCLAIVADSPTTQITSGRIRPFRSANPGELYEYSKRAFSRLQRVVREQGLGMVRTAAELRAATPERPSVIVSAEGADFLEGKIERLDEAYDKFGLRHLQLTHYRVNELGDIQTEPAEKGGLTPFGAEVVRRCNQRGIVVDVAHGTFELVKMAAQVTAKPLVLSHTSLTEKPQAWTRLITPDHARAIAGTGGVIGIWPIKQIFGTFKSWAQGMARMADVVGVDGVGVGTDLLGLPGGSTIEDYNEMPQLAAALRERFNAEETAKILGGNYRRVFEATLA